MGAVAWAISQRSVSHSAGSPEAVARPRFLQNVACGLPSNSDIAQYGRPVSKVPQAGVGQTITFQYELDRPPTDAVRTSSGLFKNYALAQTASRAVVERQWSWRLLGGKRITRGKSVSAY
jgi:hypothetical protein